MHGSDLSGEVDLLQTLLDDAVAEIACLRRSVDVLRGRVGGAALKVRVAGEGRLPCRAYGDDAGFDLFVQGDWTVEVGSFVDIECGVSVELPEGYCGTW